MRYALLAVLSVLLAGCDSPAEVEDLGRLTVQALAPEPWSTHDSTFTCTLLVRNPSCQTVVGQTSCGPPQTARCYNSWGGLVAEYPNARYTLVVELRFAPGQSEAYEVTVPVGRDAAQSALGPGIYRVELGFLDHSKPCDDLWVTVR